MASSGPNNPTTGADVAGVGTLTWTTPNNILASDNADASITSMNGTSHWLQATGFGFAIPAGSTINGIVVGIERAGSSYRVQDSTLKLLKAGTVVGDSKAATGTNWPAADAYASYGGAADLWGTAWSVAEINAANFGVALSAVISAGKQNASAYVDHMRITVYYTEGAGGGNPYYAYQQM